MLSYKNFEIADTVERLSRQIVTVRNFLDARNQFGYHYQMQSTGTGIIISGSGYIVTNLHVLNGSHKPTVLLKDDRIFDARIMGYDAATDLALLRISANDLDSAEFGDSTLLRPGEPVIALGNALGLPGGPTVSAGVVSAVQRPLPWADFIFEGLIQTDASINPGNSGGPLATLDGRIIGINTAIIPSAQGVGFAIPSNTIKHVVQEILENGRVIRPWLGISGSSEPSDFLVGNAGGSGGVVVMGVAPLGPAFLAGIRPGDVILKFNSNRIRDMRGLIQSLEENGIGKPAEVLIRRGSTTDTVTIIPETMPTGYLGNMFRR